MSENLMETSPDELFSEEVKAMLVFAVEEAEQAVYDDPDRFSEGQCLALEALKAWLDLA